MMSRAQQNLVYTLQSGSLLLLHVTFFLACLFLKHQDCGRLLGLI